MSPRRKNARDLTPRRQQLARLIDTAIAQGQHAPEPGKPYEPCVWTNESFGDAVVAEESTVRGWRDTNAPHTRPNITSILRVLYGDALEFRTAKDAMRLAWYRAKGIAPPEPEPPGARNLHGPQPFSDAAEIIDLAMSQPPPTNGATLSVPFTFRVYPDRDCTVEDATIAIGVEQVLVVVESDYWQPMADSVFRGAKHGNTGDTAVPGGALFDGPRKGEAWIDGKPLGDAPVLELERKQDGDGPVAMSARVKREDFVVVPRRVPGDNRPPETVDNTKKKVLDALFAGAYDLDARRRLVVARTRIGGPVKA